MTTIDPFSIASEIAREHGSVVAHLVQLDQDEAVSLIEAAIKIETASTNPDESEEVLIRRIACQLNSMLSSEQLDDEDDVVLTTGESTRWDRIVAKLSKQ